MGGETPLSALPIACMKDEDNKFSKASLEEFKSNEESPAARVLAAHNEVSTHGSCTYIKNHVHNV